VDLAAVPGHFPFALSAQHIPLNKHLNCVKNKNRVRVRGLYACIVSFSLENTSTKLYRQTLASRSVSFQMVLSLETLAWSDMKGSCQSVCSPSKRFLPTTKTCEEGERCVCQR
jgi:hypothetical protein